MVNKTVLIQLCLLFFVSASWGQEKETEDLEVDSLKVALKKEELIVFDSISLTKKPLNPLAPSKAAFLSAAIPGLGQIYNKSYWKLPFVYGAIGGSIYGYTFYDKLYKDYRKAFKRRRAGFTDDKYYDLRLEDGEVTTRTSPEIDDQRLERLQNDRQGDRDNLLLVTILFYALNIVDANVDAHLKQFNIDDDLSLNMEIEPFLELNPITSDPNYGMALIIKF